MSTGGEPLDNGTLELYNLDARQADTTITITEKGEILLIDADKDTIVDELETAETSEALCQHLRETPGAHKDFLYAIETPDAHTKNKSEKELSESLERTNQRERTQERDVSLRR